MLVDAAGNSFGRSVSEKQEPSLRQMILHGWRRRKLRRCDLAWRNKSVLERSVLLIVFSSFFSTPPPLAGNLVRRFSNAVL